MPSPTAASSVMPIDWSTRPISSIARHSEVNPPSSPAIPAPPNSSGAVRPIRPSAPIFWTTSVGKWWSRSHCAACGRDLGLGEVADATTELLVLGGQLEGHASQTSGAG